MNTKIRVLLAKPGLDGHDKGIKQVARALVERGMEVVYLGMRQIPEGIAQAVIQEDPHIVGLSILSGAHLNLTRKVVSRLRDAGCREVLVIVGGTIPLCDVESLKKIGVAEVFPTGSAFADIVSWIEASVLRNVSAASSCRGFGQ